MNEDQASALFAPARERPLPPAAFSMADVFAADARLRRRRRTAAVVGTVAAAVLAVVGFFALSGTGNPRAVTPEVTPSPTQTTESLASLIDQIVVPPNSTRTPTDPTGDNRSFGSGAGFQQLDRYWTSQLTALQGITALTAHLPNGLSGPGRPTVDTIGGRIDQREQFDAPETATMEGPHLLLDAQELPAGLTSLAVHAWETVKPAKTADEVIPSGVTSVEASITVFEKDTPIPSTLSGVAAQRLADDINGLWVKVSPEAAGCGGSPANATSFRLTFRGPAGNRVFTTACDGVYPSPQAEADPALWKSRALVADLQADFGALLPAPLQKLDYLQGPQPTTVAAPANLQAIIDHLTPPSGAQEIPPPPDLQDGRGGYAYQPGYQQAIRAWTTTLDPDTAMSALVANPPPGMSGGPPPPEPGGKGPPETDASYKKADTATRIGPRLELSAVEETPGTTTIEAVAWEVDKTAKPVRDTVTGTVRSVTGSWAGGQEISAPKELTQKLADDVNSLMVNNSALPPGCSRATPALTLTFHTSTGDEQFDDSCGLVQVLPIEGALPELETSDPLNLDVNKAFGSLLATPLPTSAPLPTTTTGAGRRADQLLTDAPATISIETVQAVSKGKQRMTDQTFDLTGPRAAKLLADLKALPVYNGPVPLGCQPDMRTANVVVTQTGRQLHYVSYCEGVTIQTGATDFTYRPSTNVDNDLTVDFATLRPSRSVDPPLNSSLLLSITTLGTTKEPQSHPLAGTVKVTQDGAVLATRQLAAGENWTLPLRQGWYTITMVSLGHTCPPEVIRVFNHEQTGLGGNCT